MREMASMKTWATIVLTIGISLCSGVFAAMVFAQNTYVTVREKEDIVGRLDRIEEKVDILLRQK